MRNSENFSRVYENGSENFDLTPKQIVKELDRHIIGQNRAKKILATAIRNQIRREKISTDLKYEIKTKNILMIGPTGTGKTELGRRLAKLIDAPFVKIEVTKFTEIGYVGKDVDSIVRDLIEASINNTKNRLRKVVREKAKINAEERILDSLVGSDASEETRERFRELLRQGELEKKEIEIKISENSTTQNIDIFGGQIGIVNVSDMLNKTLGISDRKKMKKMTVEEAFKIVINEEEEKLLDEDKIIKISIEAAESRGIIFLDEIDKIVGKHDRRGGEVSREGVQRDLLPLLDGSYVNTKYGTINTSNILFIASGAFHVSRPSDLLPELQGRLPIRVELQSLTKEDMIAILQEPEASLIKQYVALIATENIELKFTDEAIDRISEIAIEVNNQVENIGARRLYTIMEKLLEEFSFNATAGSEASDFTIDNIYVDAQLGDLSKKIDLAKFIL